MTEPKYFILLCLSFIFIGTSPESARGEDSKGKVVSQTLPESNMARLIESIRKMKDQMAIAEAEYKKAEAEYQETLAAYTAAAKEIQASNKEGLKKLEAIQAVLKETKTNLDEAQVTNRLNQGILAKLQIQLDSLQAGLAADKDPKTQPSTTKPATTEAGPAAQAERLRE